MYTIKIIPSKHQNGLISSPGKSVTLLTRAYIGVDQGSGNYSPPAISSLFPVFVNKVYKAVFTQLIFLLLYNKLPQMQQLNANVLCHSFYSLGVQIQFICVLSSCFHRAEIKVSPAAAILSCHSSELTLVVSRIRFLVTITGSPVFLLFDQELLSAPSECPHLFATWPLQAVYKMDVSFSSRPVGMGLSDRAFF